MIKPAGNTAEAEIGRRISEYRRAAGLKPEALAERLGISIEGVKKLQNGSSTTQFAKLINLAQALGVTPNDILGFSWSMAPNETVIGVLAHTYQALGLDQEKAHELAEAILKVLLSPPIENVDAPPKAVLQIQAELVIRPFLKSKPS